jgi:spore maturation protein CgeB
VSISLQERYNKKALHYDDSNALINREIERFIVSDNQKDPGELFEPEKEAVCYNDNNELKNLVKYYTVNSTARQHITEAAQKRILHEHTYYHRVKRIQETL